MVTQADRNVCFVCGSKFVKGYLPSDCKTRHDVEFAGASFKLCGHCYDDGDYKDRLKEAINKPKVYEELVRGDPERLLADFMESLIHKDPECEDAV